MRPLLILRPEPGASATAAKAAARGLDVLVRPLFEVRAIDWTPPDPARFDAVMMTSANAARVGGAGLARYRYLPLYAVGSATAKAARDAGFDEIVAGGNDAAAMTQIVAGDGRKHVLHLAGRDRIAAPAPFGVETIAVYASEVVDGPALPPGTIALLHSPRAARRFAELVAERGDIALVAISQGAADAAGTGWQHILTAARPDDTAMLELAASLCETRGAQATGP